MDWEHEPTLRSCRDAAGQVEKATRDLHACVAAARAAGFSWELIGAAVGISRQAAWERFKDD